MTFKIIIQQMPISAEFEVGSLSEAVGILQEQESEIRKLGEIANDLNGGTSGQVGEQGEATNATGETAPKPKRGRPAKGADPATAQAPAPLPIPGANPPPPAPAADMTSTDGGIPPGLKRDPATNPPPAIAAPPLAPPPPPPAPAAAPPSGILAGKIIANLDARKATTPDDGKSLADWLATAGLVVAGSTYDEAINAVRLIPDDKLATVAGLLQVA
jgi:hypothetical protein